MKKISLNKEQIMEQYNKFIKIIPGFKKPNFHFIKDEVSILNSFYLTYCKDVVYASIFIHSSGMYGVNISFEKLDKTYENLKLINAYNQNNDLLKGFISENGYFYLVFREFNAYSLEEAFSYVAIVLYELDDDDVEKYLTPILNNTYVDKYN